VSVFVDSARYYDAFYENKDYAAEVDYVCSLLQKNAPGAVSVLDLGCGTGRHARLLAERGFRVVGVDRSAQMLNRALALRDSAPARIQDRLRFHECDVGKLRLGAQFDVVVALFHVMSYQTSNEALGAAIGAAKSHLHSQGIFLFDCWYGPGVLSDPPTTRLRRIEEGTRHILRIAEPKLLIEENVVEVNYQFIATDSASGAWEEFRETHRMRYFFKPDMFLVLESHGFQPLGCLEWMKDDPPGEEAWNVVFISRIGS
jgi:SAM-dependent methyltransferase